MGRAERKPDSKGTEMNEFNTEIFNEIKIGIFARVDELTEITPEVTECLLKWKGL
jgi:PHP family Zn ribbon phosphoesterase